MPRNGIDDVADVQGQAGKVPAYSPNYREEAERIVAEERAQTEKMPVYEVSLRAHVEHLEFRLTGRVWRSFVWSKRWETVLSPMSIKPSSAKLDRSAPSRSCASMSSTTLR